MPYVTTISTFCKIGVVILHIYGARSIFLIFYDHQDTESEQPEIEIGVAGPIFAQKKISKALYKNDIHTMQDK